MIAAIVQARIRSTRLRGKALADIDGKRMLTRVTDRLRRADVDEVVVCVPEGEAAQFRSATDLRVVGGPETDVLARYVKAADECCAEAVVRVTSDCPCVDPDEVDRILDVFEASGCAFTTNHQCGIPHGLDVEVFTRDLLEEAQERAGQLPAELGGDMIREHVDVARVLHMLGRGEQINRVWWEPDASKYRLTVDYPEDMELVRSLYTALGPDFGTADALAWLDKHPEVYGLNRRWAA